MSDMDCGYKGCLARNFGSRRSLSLHRLHSHGWDDKYEGANLPAPKNERPLQREQPRRPAPQRRPVLGQRPIARQPVTERDRLLAHQNIHSQSPHWQLPSSDRNRIDRSSQGTMGRRPAFYDLGFTPEKKGKSIDVCGNCSAQDRLYPVDRNGKVITDRSTPYKNVCQNCVGLRQT